MNLRKLSFLIICLLIAISNFSGDIIQHDNKYIVEMTKDEYGIYLIDHEPLDRLYARGDRLFFLIDEHELANLHGKGIKPKIEPFNQPILQAQAGDVNGAFHNYLETERFLEDLESRYPDLVSFFSIGKTFEGRELYMIRISDNPSINENEPNLYIIGCHHAREWLTVEVPLLFAQYILDRYNSDPEIQNMINNSQIYILPLFNPDGLEFSVRYYRMWRKNRNYLGESYYGVDINRNYGYMWGYDDEGSSPYPYSVVYRGAGPFSENETKALGDFMVANPPNGVISYHSYSQVILGPWGYTIEPPPDFDELNNIAAKLSELMYSVNGRLYTYGSSSQQLYLVNGDLTDWVYGIFKVPAFTIELPPTDFHYGGFITGEEMIGPVFNENLPALLYFVNYCSNRTVISY